MVFDLLASHARIQGVMIDFWSIGGAGGDIPLGVTPPITRVRAAANPGISSSITPPSVTRATTAPASGRGARGGQPPITMVDLMERQEVLAKAQTDMAATQKEVLTFLKVLTDRLPQEPRQPLEPTRNTFNAPGAGTSAARAYMDLIKEAINDVSSSR